MISLLFRTFILLVALTTTAYTTAHARKVALIMGASGEDPKLPTTDFDEGISAGVTFLKESGFETDVLYNGAHVQGRAAISRAAGKTPPPFDAKNIEATLTQLENQKFAPGDQVAIVIETHGWDQPQKDGFHCVMMEGKKCWSPGRLEKLKAKMEAQGVKLAILDHSCFSGSTLNLQGPNTCVQTGADSKSFGMIAHGPSFWAQARKNRDEGKPTDLESIFADARAGEYDMSSPQISTQTNRNLRRLELQLLDLRRFDENNPRHANYIEYKPTADSADLVPQCLNPGIVQKLSELKATLNAADVDQLAQSVKRYNELRAQLDGEIQKIQKTAIDTVEIKGRKIPIHLLEVQDRFLAKPMKKRDQEEFFRALNFDRADELLYDHLKKAAPNKIELNKIRFGSPAATQYEELRDNFSKYMGELKTAAGEINGIRNRIFSDAYKQTRLNDGNACSQFKF